MNMFNSTYDNYTNTADSEESIETDSDNTILEYIYQQIDNFEVLKGFVISKDIRPSTIFLPQVIKQIDNELSLRTDLLLDCIDFLDIVKIYSLLLYSDEKYFTSKVIKIIVENRTVNNTRYMISKESIDDFIFKSKDEAIEFMENNKALLSIYICSLVLLIFFER